ncbi:protein SRC2 [Spinacia oleracea]|uniref:Protein SRC2 n=1 Tax=Spinacia oleracea TaxID=3562 RepID=A0A9R0I7U3_SPIOL|nr:protein SRC2-like [Spinacia oleracea]
MAYSRYEVEVTLSSAKDLKNINWRNGPIRPYVVAWIDPDRRITSRADDEGDTSPEWNQTLTVPLDRPIEDATLCIDVVHHTSRGEDIKPLIGSTKLDLCDVVDDVGIGGRMTRSLKLKRPSGRPQGKLELEIVICDPRSYRGSDPYPAPQHVDYGVVPKGGYDNSHVGNSEFQHQTYNTTPQGGYAYEQPPAYGQAAPYGNPGYGQPGYGYGSEQVEEKKKSGFGGMGTGLAIGAVGGLVGGIALAEGFDQLEDHIADEAAEQVEDDLGDEDED